MHREKIRRDIRNIRNLPTLPTVIAQVMEIVNSQEMGARDLAEVISRDQSLSAKILSLANSAFYGFSKRIRNTAQATVILGFETIRSLVLSTFIFDTFLPHADNRTFDREAFWIHSIGCGLAAQAIARELGQNNAETVFCAGLLHDLGKVVLDTYYTGLYQEVVQKMDLDGTSAFDAETQILGIDHAEVGALLANRWKFPEVLINPIAHHHHPQTAKQAFQKETLIVHLANILIKRADIGLHYETQIPEPDGLVRDQLRLPEEKIAHIENSLQDEKERIGLIFYQLVA